MSTDTVTTTSGTRPTPSFPAYHRGRPAATYRDRYRSRRAGGRPPFAT